MWIAVALAAIGVVLALYASWTARRLDRLHARVDAAAAALDGQLLRRAEMAIAFGASLAASGGVLPAGSSVGVDVEDAAAHAATVKGLGHDREVVENAVSRLLVRAVAACADRLEPTLATTEMHDEALRATFARRFYNDTVRDALVVRDLRVVRWLRLAGRARHPSYFEMNDEELAVPRISVASGPTMEG